MTSGTKPNTSLILTPAELEYIHTHFAGSKSAAIHKAMETMMNTEDRIHIWVVDTETGTKLEDLGICFTDNPSHALEMYREQEMKWCDKGYAASLRYADVEPAKK